MATGDTQHAMTAKEEVRNQEAAAEAGPAAAVTNAVPRNELLEGHNTHDDSDTAAGSDISTRTPPEKETVEQQPQAPHNDEARPLEQSGKGKIAIVMSALGLAVFLAALDITIITTALPTISEHFESAAGYTWIGSAYLLASASTATLWGKVSDIFGRKPVLLFANLVFFVGSLVAALSNSIGMLIAARAVQGTGGGGLVTLVNICISDLFSLRSRGAYFGIIGGVWALASGVGPILGGVFTEKVSWRWCFYINLPLDGAAFLIILFFLDLKTPKTPIWEGLKAIDWIGALAILGGTLMFLFGLEFGGVTYPWSSAIVLCLIIFGIVTWGLFFINEWKLTKHPIMPLHIFKYRNNCAALGCCFIHGMVYIAASYYLPLYFQAVRGATPLLSGVYLLANALALSFASIATGIFIRKTGKYRAPIWFGFFWMTVGYGLFTNFYANSSWAKLILYQIVAGIGIGPLFQAPLIALQTQVKPRDIATATAAFGFIRQLGTSISVVLGQVVYQNQFAKSTPQLNQALGPQTAQLLAGSGAGANVKVIDALPEPGRTIARTAFADALHPMWIMYVCISAVGLLVSFLIKSKTLSKEHEVTKTGLEAEQENVAARAQEKHDKDDRKAAKRASGQLRRSHDVEKANVPSDGESEMGHAENAKENTA